MSLGTDKKQLLTGSKVERGVLGSICDYSHTHTKISEGEFIRYQSESGKWWSSGFPIPNDDYELQGGRHGNAQDEFCFIKSQSHVLTMWQIKNQRKTHTQPSRCGWLTEPNHNWEDPLRENLKVVWQTANTLRSNACRLRQRRGIHAIYFICHFKTARMKCQLPPLPHPTHTHTRWTDALAHTQEAVRKGLEPIVLSCHNTFAPAFPCVTLNVLAFNLWLWIGRDY